MQLLLHTPHSTHHTTAHHTHHTHAHTQRTTTTELESTVKDRLGEDLRVSRGLDTVLKLTAESSCKEQTYEIPACNNHLTVGAVCRLVDITLCLLKIFTERGYFFTTSAVREVTRSVNGKCGARRLSRSTH